MPVVTFLFESGSKLTAKAEYGEVLLEVARRTGVAIDAPCDGNGTCGKCRVKLIDGDGRSEPSRHITDDDYAAGWRLACSTRVDGDITVAVPESAAAFKTGIRTADLNDPAVHAAFVKEQEKLREAGVMPEKSCPVSVLPLELEMPTLDDTRPDAARLTDAIEAVGFENVTITFPALRVMARVLRENDFKVCCVIEERNGGVSVLDILPSEHEKVCGLAIDIGTTTVTGVLADLESGELLARASAGNGQIRFGADVINRIIGSTRPGGSERLRRAVVEETIVPLIATLCRNAGVSQEHIYRCVIAGNTTMSHLFLGLYADPVRMEPYIPSFFHCSELRAGDVIPGLNGSAGLVLAPNVGSYVGGDITAGVLASTLWNSEQLTLFIDLGTNGELVLGNSDYMFTCACSAGPAFEGGDISCGMRATNGAVQGLKIDRETMEPSLEIIGEAGQKPAGLCGSGLLDTVAGLFLTGIIDARGKFAREGKRIRYDEHGMGRYVIAEADESADGREISINEVDLDNFIRAKGAIFSAILLMIHQLDMEVDCIERILIAGGIGGGIDFDNAVTIGMLPDVDRERFLYLGNTSLSGAYAILMSGEAQKKVEEIGQIMMYVELSNEPGYMDEFVSACFLPHTNGSLFPSVEA